MRYSILKLEEEVRIVLDVRRSISNDPDLSADGIAALMIETARQLRDLVYAIRALERLGDAPGHPVVGESTLSANVRNELIAIIGFVTQPPRGR